MTEQELRDAYGMGRHERRQYEDGEGCSCGKEWGHERACVRYEDFHCLTHTAYFPPNAERCESR